MSTKASVALAVAAGFMGGAASHYLMVPPVYAQAQGTTSQETRSQRFVLVDENGVTRGVFGFHPDGSPDVQISYGKGNIFSARWWGVVRKKNKFTELR
jgi:hypothetical protein